MSSCLYLIALYLTLLSNAEVIHLDEENFQEITKEGLWYLEFYAPWCGHCKNFAPIYEEASNDPDLQNIKFAAIDATSQKELAKQFGVSRFPTIKFYEDGEEYKYSGQRTIESLKEQALKMLQPVVKDFTIDSFSKSHDRFTVSFLYMMNDDELDKKTNDENTNKFTRIAKRFRPEIPFYSLKYSSLNTQQKDFMQKLEVKSLKSKQSMIAAITPSIPNNEYNAEKFDEIKIQKFIERNRYAPIIEMKLGNYRDLVDNCGYFAIIFISGETDAIQPNELKLIDAAEKMVLANPEWNQQSYTRYKQWESEQIANDVDIKTLSRNEREPIYRMIVSWCNSTEYEEWASHTFSITEEQLPLMLVYTPKADGYWVFDQDGEKDMLGWLNDVFNNELEITYTRSWIARQAMKLERWLNSLSGLAIGGVFVGVFVCLCAIMVALDYFCSPAEPLKTD